MLCSVHCPVSTCEYKTTYFFARQSEANDKCLLHSWARFFRENKRALICNFFQEFSACMPRAVMQDVFNPATCNRGWCNGNCPAFASIALDGASSKRIIKLLPLAGEKLAFFSCWQKTGQLLPLALDSAGGKAAFGLSLDLACRWETSLLLTG